MKTYHVHFQDKVLEVEAVSFTIEDGALVFWSEKCRTDAIAAGGWSAVDEQEVKA